MGDVCCVQGSGILLLTVMEGCWLCPMVRYSLAGCYGVVLFVSVGQIFFS